MKTIGRFANWWKPLPFGLKLVTVLAVYPAWFFIMYCIFTGQAKSTSALVAFLVFASGVSLHIAFDARSRRVRRDGSGLDFYGEGD